MRNLARAVLHASEGGAVVPTVYTSLAARQVHIRKAEVSMIAGPPGSGKSTLALSIAARAGVGTLYFSADTHPHTMSLRLISMLTNKDQAVVEQYMDNDRDWAADVLKRSQHIRWSFDSAPSLQDIEEEILAYREAIGADPELIVIDNAIDVTHDSGDEWSSLRSLMRELKWWARETEAAILVLHHTSEGVTGDPCPPMRSLHGKVAQTPALILTINSASSEGFMGVASVKNRYGPANPGGGNPVWLNYNPGSMFLADLETA